MFDLLVSGLGFAVFPDTFHKNEGSAWLQRVPNMAQYGFMCGHLVVRVHNQRSVKPISR